jgi:hypothetical protein
MQQQQQLTNNSKINFQISRRRVAKVHATSVHALVWQLDVVDQELSGMRCRAKEGPTAEGRWRRP